MVSIKKETQHKQVEERTRQARKELRKEMNEGVTADERDRLLCKVKAMLEKAAKLPPDLQDHFTVETERLQSIRSVLASRGKIGQPKFEEIDREVRTEIDMELEDLIDLSKGSTHCDQPSRTEALMQKMHEQEISMLKQIAAIHEEFRLKELKEWQALADVGRGEHLRELAAVAKRLNPPT